MKQKKKTLTAMLVVTAVLLSACSDKSEKDSSSYIRSADISSSTSESAEDSTNDSEVGSSDSDAVALVKTGENTLKSEDNRLECTYKVHISNNLIRLTVLYTNISEYEMSCNIKPKLFDGDTELEETFYGDSYNDRFRVIGIGETFEDSFDYDSPDSDEVSVVFEVNCECMYELDSANPEDDNKKTWLEGAFYTSDSDKNGEDDFVISLE